MSRALLHPYRRKPGILRPAVPASQLRRARHPGIAVTGTGGRCSSLLVGREDTRGFDHHRRRRPHVSHPENIRIADAPADFADRCIELLEDADVRKRVANAAWEMVNANFPWEQVSRCFKAILEQGPRLR